MFGPFSKHPSDPGKRSDTALEFFRACNVYCRPEADQVIVASVYNHGGLIAEKATGTSILKFSDPIALHEAVLAALDACEYEEKFDYSDRKKSDWPAYRASGSKTMKSFEAEFIPVFIKGVNKKNLFYEMTTPEFGEFGMHLTMTVNAYDTNYGETIPYVVEKYLACRSLV